MAGHHLYRCSLYCLCIGVHETCYRWNGTEQDTVATGGDKSKTISDSMDGGKTQNNSDADGVFRNMMLMDNILAADMGLIDITVWSMVYRRCHKHSTNPTLPSLLIWLSGVFVSLHGGVEWQLAQFSSLLTSHRVLCFTLWSLLVS